MRYFEEFLDGYVAYKVDNSFQLAYISALIRMKARSSREFSKSILKNSANRRMSEAIEEDEFPLYIDMNNDTAGRRELYIYNRPDEYSDSLGLSGYPSSIEDVVVNKIIVTLNSALKLYIDSELRFIHDSDGKVVSNLSDYHGFIHKNIKKYSVYSITEELSENDSIKISDVSNNYIIQA